MLNIETLLSNRKNYGNWRNVSNIKYICIHYTANDGDLAVNNAKYFRNNVIYASAHYFVDSNSIYQSVPDDYVGYSVGDNLKNTNIGGGKYHGVCGNANSISIELTDDKKNGVIYPSEKTIELALELVRMLMAKYNIPVENVIRHFDVSGKICPAYWAGSDEKNIKWLTEFHNRILEGKEGDEMVERKEINLFGANYGTDTIVKEGKPYISLDAFSDAGFFVTEGEVPQVNMKTVSLNINGDKVDMPGVLTNGTNYAPVRRIAEALGENVGWDQENQIVTIDKKKIKVNINGEVKEISGNLSGGTNYGAIREIAEALGCKVDWDPNTSTVIITSEEAKKEDKEEKPKSIFGDKINSIFHSVGKKENK